MKKIIFIILVFSLNNIYAEGSCLIENQTAPFLSDYIKNNKLLIKNITKTITNTKKDKQNEKQGDSYKEMTRFYNTMINWNGYYSYFKYYVTFPLTNEIPSPINRDYKLLEDELKGLNNYYLKIIKKGYGDIKMKEGKTIKETLKNKIIDFENLINNYRLAVIGDELEGENTYNQQLQQYYGTKSVSACNSSSKGFLTQITEKISTIKDITKDSDKSIQKWKDAWNMLIGNPKNKDSYAKQEKELLARELTRQGIPMDQKARMLKQLDNYNKDGLTLENNFISNTFNSVKESITKQVNKFHKEVFEDFKANNKYQTNPYKKNIDIKSLLKKSDTDKITEDIARNVSTLYENEVPLSLIADVNIDKLISRIIKMHGILKQSINKISSTCRISVKVCNSQDSGNGNCGQCN